MACALFSIGRMPRLNDSRELLIPWSHPASAGCAQAVSHCLLPSSWAPHRGDCRVPRAGGCLETVSGCGRAGVLVGTAAAARCSPGCHQPAFSGGEVLSCPRGKGDVRVLVANVQGFWEVLRGSCDSNTPWRGNTLQLYLFYQYW